MTFFITILFQIPMIAYRKNNEIVFLSDVYFMRATDENELYLEEKNTTHEGIIKRHHP